MKPKFSWHNVGLFLLALWMVVRMVVLLPVFRNPGRVQLIDTNTYLELATSMLERGTYEGYSRDNIDLVRTPGYPLFLAAVMGVSGGNLAFLALAQVLLTIGTCAAVYAIGRRILGPGAGLAAAWIFALSPTSLFFAMTALTETLFALLLSLSILTLVVFHQTSALRWGALSGVLLGAATLVRPIGVWLIPLWTLFALISQPKGNWRKRLTAAGVVFAAGWLALLPWQARNLAVSGSFTLTPVAEATIRNWMIAPGLAEAKGITREQAVAEIANADDPQKYMLDAIRMYPKAMLRAQLTGIYRTTMGFEYGTWMILLDVERPPGREYVNSALARNFSRAARAGAELIRGGYYVQFAVTTWSQVHTWVLLILAAASLLYLALPGRCIWCYALLILVSGYLIVVPFAAGQARFRVPVDPLLAVLGGLGLGAGIALIGSLRRRGQPEISQ
jgi:4-amino-4-deoxy-L-arabinose transferase-like glycosyltransferase